jgi:hypothetical protein
MDSLDLDGAEADGAEVATMPKEDGRSRTSKANSQFAGVKKGTQFASKRTYPADKLIDATAEAILSGGRSPLTLRKVGPVTDHDKRTIARITDMSADEFTAELSATLRTIARATGERIMEKLEEGGQKLSDLNMTLAISVDKMAALNAKASQSGSVSVTVNNYGQMTREQMLQEIAKDGKTIDVSVRESA